MNHPEPVLLPFISLEAAELMTGISRRTLWRRVADGVLDSGPKDARGRATLGLDALREPLQEYTGLSLGPDEQLLLLQADTGQADAQTELGALLYLRNGAAHPAPREALHWLQQAADQGHADAMHWLALTSAAQHGAPCRHEALMWLGRAATAGHMIARQQLDSLLASAQIEPAAR